MAPSSSSSLCFITNLPSPILMEILCRLPIKTLIACKRVCKSWLNLPRDPHFTQLHQAGAPTEVCFQLRRGKGTLKLHVGNFHCLNNLDPLDVNVFSLRLDDYSRLPENFNFFNSCNGLLCYGYECGSGSPTEFAVVWSPCTSEFITLPALATPYRCYYGLGFSGKTNKYKLLRLVDPSTGDSLDTNVVAEICAIEKGCSWDTLGLCPSSVWEVITGSDEGPTFLHSTLHWPSDSEGDINILTFDFEDYQFGRIPLPPSFGKINSRSYLVGELLGCLFTTEYTENGMNIWLMKEYGVQDSWTKMYSLPCLVKRGESLNQNFLLPLTCMDDGEILLADGGFMSTCVFSYNPDQEGFRLIGPGLGSGIVIPYKPSLVSLKDSMLGYKVHVSALKHREMSTQGGKRKGHVKATSESSVFPNVSATMRKETEKKMKVVVPSKK